MKVRKFTDSLLLARQLRKTTGVFKTLSEDKHSEIRTNIARLKDTPPEILKSLTSDHNVSVRRALAKNPSAPFDTIEALSKDTDEAVCFGVATNAASNQVALMHLYNQIQFDFTRQLAKHENSSPDLLLALSQHKDDLVRRAVASNQSTPTEVLSKLETDIQVRVSQRAKRQLINRSEGFKPIHDELQFLREIAKDTETASEKLAELSKHEDYYIRKTIAENASTPDEVLLELAKDSDDWVKGGVLSRFKLSDELIDYFLSQATPYVLSRILRHNNVPKSAIDKYYNPDGCPEILEALASNPKLSIDRLELLAHHESWRVAVNVTKNPSTPSWILSILADRDDHVINANLAIRSKALGKNVVTTPIHVLEKLARDNSKNSYMFKQTLALFTNNPAILDILAEDKNLYVLRKVVENVNTSEKSLKKLAQHKNKRVRMSFFEMGQPRSHYDYN